MLHNNLCTYFDMDLSLSSVIYLFLEWLDNSRVTRHGVWYENLRLFDWLLQYHKTVLRHSIGYSLVHWWLSKVKTIYISSMETDICDFFDNIPNTSTFHLTIFFLTNSITFWSVQKVKKCLILKFDTGKRFLTSQRNVQMTISTFRKKYILFHM